MELEQGATPAGASAQSEGAPATASADTSGISQFVADPSAGGSAPVQSEGQPQVSQSSDEQIRHLQSLKDQAEAKALAFQYQLQQMQTAQQQFQQPQPQAPQGNPYDYQTNFPAWQSWETQAAARLAAQESTKAVRQEFEGLVRQSQEMQWIQQHPGVDVTAVKMFNRMNGIADWNLDVGYKLMTLPQTLTQVQQQTAQQTINSFKNPTQGAQPLRGQSGGGLPQTQFSFQKTLEAYNADPNIEETWPQGFKDAFWREVYARQELAR
jgi:hypothetical protein